MSGGRPRKIAPEPLLDMLKRMNAWEIAEQLDWSLMTVLRHLAIERAAEEQKERLQPIIYEEEFRVEITVENGHEPLTKMDITASHAIRKVS